jgi:hypothetical protein
VKEAAAEHQKKKKEEERRRRYVFSSLVSTFCFHGCNRAEMLLFVFTDALEQKCSLFDTLLAMGPKS